MSPEQGLMLAICADLDDDLPRLAYADWLEEQGEPEHAEFIRVECALARLEGTDPEDPVRRALFRRDLKLLAAHKEAWFGPVRRFCSFWECRRGFLDELTIDAIDFLRFAEEICRKHPVRHLRLKVVPGTVEQLGRCPGLVWVRRLELSGEADGDYLAEALASSDSVTRVQRLQFFHMGMSAYGARALAASPGFPELVELHLAGNVLGADGVEALLLSPNLPRLRHLTLSGRNWADHRTATPNVGSEGVIRLANCPLARRLRSLGLYGNNLHDDALLALAQSPHLDGLESLALGNLDRNGQEAREAVQARFGGRLNGQWWG